MLKAAVLKENRRGVAKTKCCLGTGGIFFDPTKTKIIYLWCWSTRILELM
jgi:hypothetical protein